MGVTTFEAVEGFVRWDCLVPAAKEVSVGMTDLPRFDRAVHRWGGVWWSRPQIVMLRPGYTLNWPMRHPFLGIHLRDTRARDSSSPGIHRSRMTEYLVFGESYLRMISLALFSVPMRGISCMADGVSAAPPVACAPPLWLAVLFGRRLLMQASFG